MQMYVYNVYIYIYIKTTISRITHLKVSPTYTIYIMIFTLVVSWRHVYCGVQ